MPYTFQLKSWHLNEYIQQISSLRHYSFLNFFDTKLAATKKFCDIIPPHHSGYSKPRLERTHFASSIQFVKTENGCIHLHLLSYRLYVAMAMWHFKSFCIAILIWSNIKFCSVMINLTETCSNLKKLGLINNKLQKSF